MSNSNSETRLWQSGNAEPRRWETEVRTAPSPPPAPAVVSRSEAPPEPRRPSETRAAAQPSPGGSVFGSSLRLKGELHADEDFVLQGRIEGSIHHTQTLTVGTDGVVKGNSRARCIIVDGTVEGDLYALESITIRPTAKVQGNLLAPRVSIADGATFNGKVDMASATRAAQSIVERQTAAPLDERGVEQLLSSPQKAY